MKTRSGTVLILVAGVSAILAMMALSFLAKIRADVNEMQSVQRETQARLMLNAACMYILEASRIGWDKDALFKVQHMETFGWIDVRDGSLGPRVNTGDPSRPPISIKRPYLEAELSGRPKDPDGQGDANFPIGKAFRFNMYVTKRPPFAILQKAAYNPIDWDNDGGISYLRYPDPLPAVDNGSWARSPVNPGGGVTTNGYSDWTKGDSTPIQSTINQAWFRLVRENTGAIFTVTCGAGGTLGFKDWKEVQQTDLRNGDNVFQSFFSNDPGLFAKLASEEIRIWYRVEWSPATTAIDLNFLKEHSEQTLAMSTPTYKSGGANNGYSGQMYSPNMGGTIQWIQRLRNEPDYW